LWRTDEYDYALAQRGDNGLWWVLTTNYEIGVRNVIGIPNSEAESDVERILDEKSLFETRASGRTRPPVWLFLLISGIWRSMKTGNSGKLAARCGWNSRSDWSGFCVSRMNSRYNFRRLGNRDCACIGRYGLYRGSFRHAIYLPVTLVAYSLSISTDVTPK